MTGKIFCPGPDESGYISIEIMKRKEGKEAGALIADGGSIFNRVQVKDL